MKWLTFLSVLLLVFLVYQNIDSKRKQDRLTWENDSLRNSILEKETKIHNLEKNYDSLKTINDSLKYKKTVEIYNQIEYKYGKEIAAANAAGITEWLSILAR